MLTKDGKSTILDDFLKKRFHKYESLDDILKKEKTLDDLIKDEHKSLDDLLDELDGE